MTIKTILRSICSRPFPHATAIFLAAVVCFALISSFNALAADVIQQGPANYVSSSDLLNPQPGTAGFDATKDNYVFYLQPGMGEGPGQTQETRPRPTTPYAPAYTNANSPVTTNKWWSAAGLQWSDGIGGGFAFGRDIQLTRTTALIEDPYYMQFVDFGTSPENNQCRDPGTAVSQSEFTLCKQLRQACHVHEYSVQGVGFRSAVERSGARSP